LKENYFLRQLKVFCHAANLRISIDQNNALKSLWKIQETKRLALEKFVINSMYLSEVAA